MLQLVGQNEIYLSGIESDIFCYLLWLEGGK